MTTPSDLVQASPDTRQRLLEAAGEIFAERGFRDARIRDISQRAGANVAAINYYFRDKSGLYDAVLTYAHGCAMERNIEAVAAAGAAGSSPEAALHAFVRGFLEGMLDTGRPAWHGRLLAREMVDPTGALDRLVGQFVRPRAAALLSIVRALLGADAAEADVFRCGMSVIGQCLHYHHARPVIRRLFPEFRYEPSQVEELARHIAEFSLAGIARVRERGRMGAAAIDGGGRP